MGMIFARGNGRYWGDVGVVSRMWFYMLPTCVGFGAHIRTDGRHHRPNNQQAVGAGVGFAERGA